jgi:4-hydroxy-tetrahydrodipicolinate synthase
MIRTLHGVIPALTTPFLSDGGIDFAGVRRLVDFVIEDGVHGILVNGCTGESWAIEDDEREELFRVAADQVAGRVPVLAGCSGMTARAAIGKVRQAEKAGCDVALLPPPSYVMPGEEEVYEFFREVAKASALPMVVYNVPRRTGVAVTVRTMARLANEPNVIGLKESSKDFLVLSEMVRALGERISVMAGYMTVLGLGALSVGAVGFIDSTISVQGRHAVEFYDAVRQGDLTRARQMQAALVKLNKGFFSVGTFPAAVKAALEILGRPGGPTRPPIKPLTAAERDQIRTILVEAGLLRPTESPVAG